MTTQEMTSFPNDMYSIYSYTTIKPGTMIDMSASIDFFVV